MRKSDPSLVIDDVDRNLGFLSEDFSDFSTVSLSSKVVSSKSSCCSLRRSKKKNMKAQVQLNRIEIYNGMTRNCFYECFQYDLSERFEISLERGRNEM
jgi:hypothetical protein